MQTTQLVQDHISEPQMGSLVDAAGEEGLRMILEAFWTSTEELTAQLEACLAVGDAKGASEIGHALKGSAANIGAKSLAEVSLGIERAAKAGDIAAIEAMLTPLRETVADTHRAVEAFIHLRT